MSATGIESTTAIPAEILGAVLALSESQRLALGHHLLESVEVNATAPYPGWPEDWEEEIERRALAVEQGGPTFTTEEVIAYARQSIKQRGQDREVSGQAP